MGDWCIISVIKMYPRYDFSLYGWMCMCVPCEDNSILVNGKMCVCDFRSKEVGQILLFKFLFKKLKLNNLLIDLKI